MSTAAQGGWLGLLALLSLLLPAGSLDPAFGDHGVLRVPFAAEGASAFDVAATADGGYAVAGVSTVEGRSVFALLLADARGRPNPSFGDGGTAVTAFEDDDAGAVDIAVLADGRLVAAGWAGTGAAKDVALARYRPDGLLDPAFGDGGRVRLDLSDDSDTVAALEILPDGSLLVAATPVRDGREAVVARLTPAGELDRSFGDGGLATVATSGGNDEAFALAVDSQGRILVAGRTSTSTSDDLLLARFTSAGESDPTFGSGGVVTTDVRGHSDTAFAIDVAGSGRILVSGGSIVGAGDEVIVAAYTPRGDLDPAFGDGGLALVDVSPGSDEAFAGALAADGGYIAVGGAIAEDGSEQGFAVRLSASGELDSSFGDGGRVITGPADGVEELRGVLADSRGRIVCAGRSLSPGAPSSFVVYRFVP